MIRVILETRPAVQVCMAGSTLSCSRHTLPSSQHPCAPPAENPICGLTLDLHLGMWQLHRGSVSDHASHLKKSLRIKSRRKGWLRLVAEQHGSSDAGWNSNVFSCVAVRSLVSFPLSGKDSTWDYNNTENVAFLPSESLNGKIHPDTDFTWVVPQYWKHSCCIHKTKTCLLAMTRFKWLCRVNGGCSHAAKVLLCLVYETCKARKIRKNRVRANKTPP